MNTDCMIIVCNDFSVNAVVLQYVCNIVLGSTAKQCIVGHYPGLWCCLIVTRTQLKDMFDVHVKEWDNSLFTMYQRLRPWPFVDRL